MVEPFLHFLIAVEWAGGRVMREYTALLDPPLYAQGDAGAISSPKVPSGAVSTSDVAPSAPGAIATAPEVAAPTTPGEVSEEPVPASAAAPTAFVGGYDLDPTRRGDTLWSIAEKVELPPGTNIYQLMIAMLNANPDAFIDGNLNRLKTGQILRVPAAAEIESLSRQSAVREYQAQLADWESFRARAAGVTQVAKVEATAEQPEASAAPAEAEADAEPAAPAASAASTEQAAADAGAEEAAEPASEGAPMAVDAGEAATAETPAEQPTVVAEAADAEQPAAELEQDLLRIVRATLDTQQGEATAASEGVAEQAEAGQAPAAEGEETSVASVDADMRRLEAKLTTLEEALLSRDLENRELREQVRLLEEQVRKTTELLEIESQNLALAQQAAAQRVAQAESAADAEPAAQQAATTAGADVAQTEAPATASEETVAAGTPRRVRQASAQDWWKRWLDNAAFNWQLIVLGVLGVAVAATGALLFVRRRRSMAQFEESILSGSALSVQSTSTDNTATSTTDTSFLSDFGVPGMGTMQADEVDPLAEAEVYIAYGRDEQAEEVLKEAIARDASREELKVKLLEIYQKRNDVNAFEMLAEELYPAQGEQTSAAWARVAAMGRKLSPQNPLFKSVPAEAAAAASVAASAAGVAADVVDEADEADEADSDLLATGSLDPRDNPFPDPMHASSPTDDDAFAAGEVEGASAEPVALEPFPEPDRAQFPDFDEIERRDSGEAVEMSAEPADVADAQGEDGLQAAGSDAGREPLDSPESIEGFADLQGFDFDGDEERAETAGSAGDADAADQDSELLELDLAFEDAPEAGAFIEADQEGGLAAQDEPTAAAVSEDSVAAVDVEPLELTDDELFGNLGGDDSAAGGDQPEAAATWDEAATKLDLAKAYLDMGDKSGARNILDEVLRDGNDGQRQQAAELAAQLAS